MRIELYGDNCRKCRLLEKNIRLAIEGYDNKATLQCVDDPRTFAQCGLLSLPGLAVNGEIKKVGKLMSVKEIIAEFDHYES